MTDLVPFNQPMDVMQLGNVLQKSGYFADVTQASQAVVKILAGQELGIGPIAAMTGIYIVKGRVTLSAGLMAAQIKRSGRYTYIVREMTDTRCAIEYFEQGRSIGISAFDANDAKSAGLAGDNWRKFPRNMLFARAMSNGAKWFCPDVFSGPVYTMEEVIASTVGYAVDTDTGEILDAEASGAQDAAQPATAPIPQTRDEWAELLKASWLEEKNRGGVVPANELAIDLNNPEEATIERIKELGKLSKARLVAMQKQEPQPA